MSKNLLFWIWLVVTPLFSTSLMAQTIFDWETSTNNGSSVTQTVNGITATASLTGTNISSTNAGGFDGTSGVVIFSGTSSATSMTVSFDAGVDINTVYAFTADTQPASWTITPTGGSNSAVNASVPASGGVSVSLNWTGVTSFTITSTSGGTASPYFGLDDITLTVVPACTDPDVPTVTASPTSVCSGAQSTLTITGSLNDATQWAVYEGSCGGTLIATTNGSSVIVNPTSATTYYVRGEGGCVTPGSCGTVTVGVTAQDNAGFSYSASSYCANAADPTPTITGVTGGTFSSTAGLSINASTGAIDVSASTPGSYTITYTTAGTCPNSSTASVTINALDDASFSYSASAYCVNAADPTPTITGLTGGTFSSTAGLSISSSTGAIDVSASTPGSYTITYTTAGTCPNSSTASVTINALDDASFSYSASAYCVNAADPTPTITGLTGGTFSSTAGLSISSSTGAIDVSASTPGSYTITYTTAGTCPNSSTASVTINAVDDASFSYSASAYCVNAADPTPTITGLTGGTFSSTAGLSISSSTGAIDVSASTPGTYTVTYTTAGTCANSSTASVTINALDDASFAYSASAYCLSGSDPTPTITGLTGGTFSSTAGISINASTGAIDVSASVPNTYTITYTTAGSCPNASTVSVTINGDDDASFSYAASSYCSGDSDPTPTITGLTGGTFSSTAGLSINASTGAIDLSASNAGTYTITYTTAGPCPTSATASVTITTTDDASFTYASSSYCISGTNPTANITGVTGGTFSSSMGLNFISTATGELNLSASTPGAYTITYTTTGTCANSETFNITVLDDNSFTASAIVDANVSCNGGSTGQVTGSATGGTSPYTYAWNNSATTATITGVMAGTYAVEITDNTGCKSDAFATVTEPTALLSSISSSTDVGCNGAATGAATVTATGGTAGYTYLWSNGATTASISGVVAGTYSVTVTDANSCTSSSSVTILEPSALSASTTVDFNVSCNGFFDGGATVNETGGTAPYSYLWSNGSTAPILAGVGAGTYTVVVTDANGCTANSSATITEPAVLLASGSVDNNVTCNGGADGGATVNVSGGTAPYAYMWDNGATTASIAGVTSGTYNVSVMDANACPAFSDATITEPAANVATISSQTNVSCNGGTDGAATVSISGGTAPYTYLWSNGATTASISGVVAGTYTVTVTDANACTANATATITEPTSLSAGISSQTNIDCNGNSTGAATASVTGGTSPYTYAWSNGATTASISGVVAGTYNLTITDANACTTTTSVTITEPTILAASGIVNANVSCNAGTDGEATIGVTGGTAPYTYAWSNAATTATITGVAAGTYSVTITDANGCTANASVTITEPAVLSASGIVNANVSCNGGADGEATVSVTGGTAPYTYAWNNTATTATITGLTAGTYSVTITDANGCTTTASATVTEPTVLTASASVLANVSCNSNTDGEATVNVTGGTAPYTYAWSNAATTASLTGVGAGTYNVTVTDANGCTATSSVTITQPVVLSASLVQNVQISCFGGNNGAIDLTVTGGTTPYAYAWSNSATTQDLVGLNAGTYSVTVTDANGCTATESLTISEPTELLTSGVVDNNITCNGGSDGAATVNATGGTAPYTYLWDNSATTASIAGVTAGTYSVTVTDANGCTSITSVTITEPAALTANTVVDANVSCNGFTDGGATVSVSAGTAPYTYLWSNGATTASITGVGAGIYTVVVTDANGCNSNGTVTITEPTLLVASASVNANVSCNGVTDGMAEVIASGGTAPYTYLWSNAATTASINGVGAGTYTVVVTDANGCTVNESVTITEPAVLVATGSINMNVSCNGASDGEATVSVTGGTAPYAYLWDNNATTATITGVVAGTYTVVITDANGCTTTESVTITEPDVLVATGVVNANVSCNGASDGEGTVQVTGGTAPFTYAWDNSATTQTIAGLAAGTYNVEVTDANACTANATITIIEPATLSASAAVDANVSCNSLNDGGATVTATGGTAPYTYLWDNAATTATVTGLAAGTYNVVVTDANGCTANASVTITQPVVLAASLAQIVQISCFGGNNGAIDLTVTGGTTPYAYAWSNSATAEDVAGLIAGTYSVTVTDANGCTATESLTITEPTELLTSTTVDNNVSCNGGSNGAATVTATGGIAPYTYLWDNAETTASVTNLPAGTHTVTVTDANGCTSVATVTITEPTAVVATTVVDANVSCNGLSDGGVTVNVTGGTAPYTYVWSNTATTASMTGLVAATYNVVVTDANGCTTTASATVTEPNVLTVSTTIQAVSCYGAMDGQITSAVTGGTAPYTYAWSNNQTTQDISGLDVGSYTVTVTDANGCVATSTTTMTQPPVLSVNATLVSNASCPTSFDGSAMANATGGVAPYTYLWDNNEITSTATALNSGVHIVSVVDANGCNQSSFVNIGESGVSDDASFAYSNAIYCANASNPTPTITGVTGGTFSGTPGLVINGTTGEINIQNSLTGTHTITYTTSGVCSNSSSVQVLIQPLELASFSYTDGEFCNYGGIISPTVTGVPGGTWTSSSTGLALDPVTGDIDLDNSTIGYYSITYTTPGLCPNNASWFMEIKGINTSYQINTITMVTVFHPGGDYQWMDCNDNYSHIALQDGQAYTPDQNGSYACEIQWRGCVDTTDCIDIVTIGTEDVELASSFDVYPNPTTGQFYVNFSADQDHITFKLYNTAGELISVEEMVHSNLMSFDIDLPKGVYLLEITNDQHESTTVRIVKQ